MPISRQVPTLSPLVIVLLIAGLGMVLPASAAPAANNLIVVNKSVDGIRLLASPTAVKRRLGKPTYISRRTVPGNSQSGAVSYQTWRYEKRKLTVTLYKEAPSTSFKVMMFDILGTIEHTSNGLRVGSSLADVQRKLPGATCKAGFAGSTTCSVRGGRTGPTNAREFYTGVSVENGKARSISVSYLQTWDDPAPG
ncbi:MAG TPA: hypothetical protein PKB03_05345 [Baekduia sp.]|nr:hypothetical protein [Baekduia sp.]